MKKTVWILSLTPVTDEPRVRRQAAACLAKGWNVVVIGNPGRTPKPDGWNLIQFIREGDAIIEIDPDVNASVTSAQQPYTTPPPRPGIYPWIARNGSKLIDLLPERMALKTHKIVRFVLRFARLPHLINLLYSRYDDATAIKFYWTFNIYLQLTEFLTAQVKAKPHLKPSLFISHDYFTAPVVDTLATRFNCPYSIDIHEFAKGQFMHSFAWRTFMSPWVDRMQKIYLPKSSFNTTVCDGIADLLAQDYAPIPRPTVIRSMPSYVEMPFRKTGERITILYHGIIYAVRGTELMLDAMPLLRPEFDMIIRGSGSEDYLSLLRNKIKTLGLSDRVRLEPPVLFNEIIPAANKCDIGYFVHEDISPQKRFTLPNKYFEYVMAGTALCVSDLPEMARLTKQYDLGKLVSGFSPQEVARVLNSLTREEIDRYKQNSLAAAKTLCWERESGKMTDAFDALMNTPHEAAA